MKINKQGWEFALLLKIAHFKVFTKKWPSAIRSCRSLKKSDVSDLLVIRANCSQKTIRSHCSLKKSDCEQFAQVAHLKSAKGAICSFLRVYCSFAHKTRAKPDEGIPNPVN